MIDELADITNFNLERVLRSYINAHIGLCHFDTQSKKCYFSFLPMLEMEAQFLL